MKSGNKILQWLTLVLCVVMSAGVLVQTAGAAEPTGKCTHATNEGVEYFTPWGVLAADANKWRSELDVTVSPGGSVVAMELELNNSSTRYQCTEVGSSLGYTTFSCNSMPNNSIISGVYFRYVPDTSITEGTELSFGVAQAFEPKEHLFGTKGKFEFPPYPCARNLDTADFVAPLGSALVFYTKKDCDCEKNATELLTCDSNRTTCITAAGTDKDKIAACHNTYVECVKSASCVKKIDSIENQSQDFLEQADPFAMVNILSTGVTTLDGGQITFTGDTYTTGGSRVMMDVDIEAEYNFNYDLELFFRDFHGYQKGVRYHHVWDAATKTSSGYIDSDGYTININGASYTVEGLDGLTNADFPLTMTGGRISNISKAETDGWGKPVLPPDADLDIFFWYENTEGTLGYQNSIFHIERHLNIQFSPECSQTAAAPALYDPCQASRQMFSASLPTPLTITNSDYLCVGNFVGKDSGSGCNTGMFKNSTGKSTDSTTHDSDADPQYVYFATRKCVNAACDWVTSTNAYVYSVTIADGGGSQREHGNTEVRTDISTTSRFNVRLYYNGTTNPFKISGVRLVVDEPGTYVIYPFVSFSDRGQTDPKHYLMHNDTTIPGTEGRIYVTVNDKDQLTTCSSPANNGYFKANWNDCLDSRLTQLLTFEQIPGKEEAWIENRSNSPVYFPYVQEWSYIPQELQIASLTYKATALSDAGQPGLAWCNPEGCYVPPYTKITITGGTFYLDSSPKYDEYRVAYARRDTYNIAHLFFNVHVKQCDKKIPNTGLSLRSPLKVNERLDAGALNPSITTRNSFRTPLNVSARVDEATNYVFTGNSLRIPAIGLGMETPLPIVHVYYEDGSDGMRWDLSTLGNYVGELEGGSYIPYGGNSVLTGHFWSGGVFKNLENLNMEDEVIIYGNDGVKYIYKVVQKFIAQPDEVYEMFQQVGDRSLTLVTCENYNLVTDEYERRYIVRAVLESQELYEEGIW